MSRPVILALTLTAGTILGAATIIGLAWAAATLEASRCC